MNNEFIKLNSGKELIHPPLSFSNSCSTVSSRPVDVHDCINPLEDSKYTRISGFQINHSQAPNAAKLLEITEHNTPRKKSRDELLNRSPDQNVNQQNYVKYDAEQGSLSTMDCCSELSGSSLSGRIIKRPCSLPIPSQTSVYGKTEISSHNFNNEIAFSPFSEDDKSTLTPTTSVTTPNSVDFCISRPISVETIHKEVSRSKSYKSNLSKTWGSDNFESANATQWKPISPNCVGTCQPTWAPSNLYSRCMICNAKFDLDCRRHYCRACGRLLCAICCDYRARLSYSNLNSNQFTTAKLMGLRRKSINAYTHFKLLKGSKLQRSSRTQINNRLSRVCLHCFKYLSSLDTNELVGAPKSGYPIRLDSAINSNFNNNHDNSDCDNFNQNKITKENYSYVFPNLNIDNLQHIYQMRIDYPLLIKNNSNLQTKNSTSNLSFDISFKSHEQWPPLVISTHSELVLQHNPPVGLLISLMDSGQPTLKYLNNDSSLDEFLLGFQTASDSTDLNITENTEKSNISMTKSNQLIFENQLSQKTPDWIPPGITVALTRNLHIHVHSTELQCCLKQSAWCFVSNGFYNLGQEEIVVLLRKRTGEILPPSEIFHQYWLIYQALINHATIQMNDKIKCESFCRPFRNRSFGLAPFRSHDCFFENFCFPQTNSIQQGKSESQINHRIVKSECNLSTSFPYGFLFIHPTHQCLQGLHLPRSPFLFGLLLHLDEAPWAYCVPTRLLTCLGKQTRFYPTSLLCDRDRDSLFDCKIGTSFLQLFTNVDTFIYSNLHEKKHMIPEVLFHINGLYIQLTSNRPSSGSDSETFETKLELFLPLSSQVELNKFLDSITLNSTAFCLTADFNPFTDSHLVCTQYKQLQQSNHEQFPMNNHTILDFTNNFANKRSNIPQYGDYITEAISIENTKRQATGVNFVVFTSGSQSLHVNIIEDGVCVHLTNHDYENLIYNLKNNSDVILKMSAILNNNVDKFEKNIPKTTIQQNIYEENDDDNFISLLKLNWYDSIESIVSDSSINRSDLSASYQVSLIDSRYLQPMNTYLVPIPYQLWHWYYSVNNNNNHSNHIYSTNFKDSSVIGDSCMKSTANKSPLRFAWTRFHILDGSENLLISDSRLEQTISLGQLANEVARNVSQGLQSYLIQLRINNRTQITLRIQLQPPNQVGYQLGASCHENGLRISSYNSQTSCSSSSTINDDISMDTNENLSDVLDKYLLPTLNSWVNNLKYQTNTNNNLYQFKQMMIVLELDFFILD